VLSHLACFFLSSGIFDGEALYLSFLCTDYILPPFQLKAKDSYFEIIRFFAEKQNVFRHRIFYAFQEYPPFQSATKSSFLVMCYFTRCHANQTSCKSNAYPRPAACFGYAFCWQRTVTRA